MTWTKINDTSSSGSLAFSSVIRTSLQRSPPLRFRLQQLAEGLMPVPAHRHRETSSHLIGSYGYILIWKVAKPLYIDVHLVAHGQVTVLFSRFDQHFSRFVSAFSILFRNFATEIINNLKLMSLWKRKKKRKCSSTSSWWTTLTEEQTMFHSKTGRLHLTHRVNIIKVL